MAWADVDLAGGVWTLRQGKTGAALAVPLHPDLLARLKTLAGSDAPERYVMPHMAELGPGGHHGLSEGFKRVAHKAGVDIMPVCKAVASGWWRGGPSTLCGTASPARC